MLGRMHFVGALILVTAVGTSTSCGRATRSLQPAAVERAIVEQDPRANRDVFEYRATDSLFQVLPILIRVTALHRGDSLIVEFAGRPRDTTHATEAGRPGGYDFVVALLSPRSKSGSYTLFTMVDSREVEVRQPRRSRDPIGYLRYARTDRGFRFSAPAQFVEGAGRWVMDLQPIDAYPSCGFDSPCAPLIEFQGETQGPPFDDHHPEGSAGHP